MRDEYKTREQLYEIEEKYHTIVKNTLDLIYEVDSKGQILYVNPVCKDITGYEQEELLGKNAFDFIHPDDLLNAKSVFQRAVSNFSTGNVTFRAKDKSEQWHWLECSGKPFRTATGEIRGVIIARDITTRKSTEKELLTRTSQLIAINDAMTILLEHGSWQAACTLLLKHALRLTESEYGFIGVVMEGCSELRIFAHSGLDWDRNVNHEFYERALHFYDERGYLVFTNFDNLFGQVITTAQVVISNNPSSDSRAGGLPLGHPPLHSFMGVPILRETEVVGLIGVANRLGGYTDNEKGRIEILSRTTSVLDDNYRRREREAALENERKRAELLVRKSREELRAFTARQESIREDERTRIAREIHDELGGMLTSLKIDLSFLQKRLPNSQDSLHERVQSMSDLVSSAILSVQKISTELRPVVLDTLGLIAAMEWQAHEFQTRTGIKSILTLPSNDITLDSELSTAVFRIFQETLTNVARHAHAGQVSVSLKKTSDNLTLNVEDNGRGIRESEISNPKSMGLIGIRERVHLFGGEFKIVGSEGEGTTLIISLPLCRQQGGSE